LTLADAAELLTAIPAEVVLLRCRWLPAIPPPALGGVVRVLEWLLISDEETLRGRGTGRLPRVPVRLPVDAGLWFADAVAGGGEAESSPTLPLDGVVAEAGGDEALLLDSADSIGDAFGVRGFGNGFDWTRSVVIFT